MKGQRTWTLGLSLKLHMSFPSAFHWPDQTPGLIQLQTSLEDAVSLCIHKKKKIGLSKHVALHASRKCPSHLHMGGSEGEESAYNVGNPGSIHGSGRYPGEGNGDPFQYSCPENSKDRGAWWLQSMGSQGVRHDWTTKIFTFHAHNSEDQPNNPRWQSQ